MVKEFVAPEDNEEMGEPIEVDLSKRRAFEPNRRFNALTVVETVYYRRDGNNPYQSESRYSRRLESGEQHYERNLRATGEWQKLDTGWIGDNVSALCIYNDQGVFDTNPSPKEKADEALRVIEVSYTKSSDESFLVRPGESMRVLPSKASSLYVRCQFLYANFTLLLIPN